MSRFVETLEGRSLLSTVAPMAIDEMTVTATHAVKAVAKPAKPAAKIPNLKARYQASYLGAPFRFAFTSESATGALKGTLTGLGFSAAPKAATLTIPFTGTIASNGKFTASAKGGITNLGTRVDFTYAFTGTASADGKTISGKLVITSKLRGHGGSTPALPFSAKKM